MKQGYTAVGVLIIVGVVLVLGALLVLSDSSNPTGYIGSGAPTGAVTAFVPQDTPCSSDADCAPPDTCQYYPGYGGYYCGDGCGPVSCNTNSDCVGEFKSECCENDDSGACVEGFCSCIDECEEAEECDPDAEGGDEQCGGIVEGSPAAKPCQPTNPGGEDGGCDCNSDGCTEGAFCSTFGVSSHPFVNPCGPNGHCVITGAEDGTVFGQCACGQKPCELLDAEGFQGDFEKCPDTVQCDEDSTCKNHDDCGGVGLGRCNEGICDCKCVSWAPCTGDTDCGGYGEGGPGGDGNYGQCVASQLDGALECMCTDELGCSPLDCIPGETPCTGDQEDCGGNGENACSDGVCEECGYNCEFFCDGGLCSDDSGDLTQEDCDSLAAQIGTDVGCTLDDNGNCDCDSIPFTICRRCYSTGSNFACGE